VGSNDRMSAVEPDDLERLFVKRVNAGDVEGLMELLEPNAVMAFAQGEVATGSDAIRQVLEGLVASGVKLRLGAQRPTLQVGEVAMTSTRLDDGAVTAEIARRQPDGSWRWLIDQWNLLGTQKRFA
jgi:ketosteroid isomerase-like protein